MAKENNTRDLILRKGLDMATELGLENVTIGQLAMKLRMSKSGVFAHFNSKENLQLAILSYAAEDFRNNVLIPALSVTAGIPRIRILVNNWINWGERLPGGCIFVIASIEYSERKGNVRDFILYLQEEWIKSLQKIAGSAIKAGDFRKDADTKQFAFELYSMLLGFHYYHRMLKDRGSKSRQKKALNQLLGKYGSKKTEFIAERK